MWKHCSSRELPLTRYANLVRAQPAHSVLLVPTATPCAPRWYSSTLAAVVCYLGESVIHRTLVSTVVFGVS